MPLASGINGHNNSTPAISAIYIAYNARLLLTLSQRGVDSTRVPFEVLVSSGVVWYGIVILSTGYSFCMVVAMHCILFHLCAPVYRHVS